VPGGITGPPCSLVGGVSNFETVKIMVMSPAGLGPENDCADEDQQQQLYT
jgi:hypothetical protein